MTPTPTEAEVAAIVAGLTKAQRACLMAMPAPDAHGRRWRLARDIPAAGRTCSSLNGLGGVDPKTLLCGPILVTPNYGPAGTYWSLTTYGLLVRQHLIAAGGGE